VLFSWTARQTYHVSGTHCGSLGAEVIDLQLTHLLLSQLLLCLLLLVSREGAACTRSRDGIGPKVEHGICASSI